MGTHSLHLPILTLSIMTSNSPTTVAASPRVHQLLQRLHTLSEAQEKSFSQMFFYGSRLVRFLMFVEIWSPKAEAHMKDKFVALDADKCRFIYLLARSLGACNVVEAGTSFGVSTIYLALAVGQNVSSGKASLGATTTAGKVIATEKNTTRQSEQGNIGRRQEMKWNRGLSFAREICWKRGAVVITDNVSVAKFLYKEFLEYIRLPENGFRTLTIPFSGGLEVSVYLPEE